MANKTKCSPRNDKKEKGTNKKVKAMTEYQRDRALAKSRKKKNGMYSA